MLMRAGKIICLIITVVMLAGCVANAVLDQGDAQIGVAGKVSSIFSKEPSDKDLFQEALSYLSKDQKEANYDEARRRLQKMVSQFPDSQWTNSAEALLMTLDRIFILQAALSNEKLKVQGEHLKLKKEISKIRDNAEQMEGKYSVEIVRLQQENEQLKKDIQQLKNLEIQLERREKMIR